MLCGGMVMLTADLLRGEDTDFEMVRIMLKSEVAYAYLVLCSSVVALGLMSGCCAW